MIFAGLAKNSWAGYAGYSRHNPPSYLSGRRVGVPAELRHSLYQTRVRVTPDASAVIGPAG